jgi:hypothetical protein
MGNQKEKTKTLFSSYKKNAILISAPLLFLKKYYISSGPIYKILMHIAKKKHSSGYHHCYFASQKIICGI